MCTSLFRAMCYRVIVGLSVVIIPLFHNVSFCIKMYLFVVVIVSLFNLYCAVHYSLVKFSSSRNFK